MEHFAFDWTLKVGDLLTFAGFICGGLWFVWTIRSDVTSLKATQESNAKAIEALERDMRVLSDATVTIARQDERMKSFERRLDDVEDDVKHLNHQS